MESVSLLLDPYQCRIYIYIYRRSSKQLLHLLKYTYIYFVQKNVDGQFELIFSFVSVWRWRAALELSRGRRWRRWCRAVRSTRERPWCSRPPSQSTPRGYGACTPSVSTAPATATPTRSRGGGRGCSIRGTRCPQTRQGRDLRVSSFLFPLSLLLEFLHQYWRDRCVIISLKKEISLYPRNQQFRESWRSELRLRNLSNCRLHKYLLCENFSRIMNRWYCNFIFVKEKNLCNISVWLYIQLKRAAQKIGRVKIHYQKGVG